MSQRGVASPTHSTMAGLPASAMVVAASNLAREDVAAAAQEDFAEKVDRNIAAVRSDKNDIEHALQQIDQAIAGSRKNSPVDPEASGEAPQAAEPPLRSAHTLCAVDGGETLLLFGGELAQADVAAAAPRPR